jgi:hypothetical protein
VHGGLVAFGIFILMMGIIGYFYYETVYFWGVAISRNYPYRDLGMIMVIGGIICIAIGAVYSPRKEAASLKSA